MNVHTELARLMGLFSPAAAPASALSGMQAGGSSPQTGATAQPPSPWSGGAGSSHCSCGFLLADCTCTEAV